METNLPRIFAYIMLTTLVTSISMATDPSISMATDPAPNNKMNILFLVADDMRPEIGAYLGPDFPSPVHPKIHTPNLDKLASKSLLLKQAYVQQALCGPSRSSLLTSRRPDTTHVYDLKSYWRIVGGNFTTIPQFFKENGYITQGAGKIFHPGPSSHRDDPISWTEPYFHGTDLPRYNTGRSWDAIPNNLTKQYPLVDMQTTDHAIEALKSLAPKSKQGQPFFLALGIHRPHLPFQSPQEFFDLYPLEDIRLPPNPYIPKDFPEIAWNQCQGLANTKDIWATGHRLKFNKTLPDATAKLVRRAYYSAVSYSDSQLGRIIDELTAQGVANNTIISFWGDHGWQLGEHKEWCKQTNFELATHAPMMIHVPGITNQGIAVEQATEFVDLFPTLVELAGFPTMETCPDNPKDVKLCTEGMSLVPLIKNAQDKTWKQRVFSQYPRKGKLIHSRYDAIMGYTMRTATYRYTEWVHFTDRPEYKPRWEHVEGIELYDHAKDPEENVNVARQPGYKAIVAGLSKLLHHGWRAAMPKQQ